MKIFFKYFLYLKIKYQGQRKNKNAKIMKIQNNGPGGVESELGGVKSKEIQAQPRLHLQPPEV